MTNEFPQPGESALAHSEALHDYMCDMIRTAGGRIGFARYVEMALYAPGLGYYSGGSTKFGPAGDFVTAPDVSPLFGATLGCGVAGTLRQLGEEAVIMEFGAGSGAMAASMLEQLAAQDALPREYWILEVSADLKARQRAAIGQLDKQLAGRVRWLDTLPQMPFRGVIVANEVLDALPFERFRVAQDGRLDSAWVSIKDEDFVVEFDKPPPELAAQLATISDQCRAAGMALPVGYTSEFCPGVPAFVFTLAHCLAQGQIVLSDYGGTRREIYFHERSAGTLLCHYRHHAHDNPFFLPGLQDITAWVDFTAVADAAIDADLTLDGYTTQTHYLIDSGLEHALGRLCEQQPQRIPMLQSEAKTLTLPGEMGERFKFIGLSRGMDGPVPGFRLRDLAATLAMES